MRLSSLLTLGLSAIGVLAHGHNHDHLPRFEDPAELLKDFLRSHPRQLPSSSSASVATTSAATSGTQRYTSSATLSPPSASATTSRAAAAVAAAAVPSASVGSTILVIARDSDSARQAYSGLNAYGIPYQVLLVPQAGVTLPTLNSSATSGNYGGIIIASEVSYDYGGSVGWQSALTQAQFQTMYDYQVNFNVRMVQYDVYPQPKFGTTPVGSCCANNVEQQLYFTNTAAFTQAGLKTGTSASVSTLGLFHYLASVTDTSTTTEIAQFAANSQYTTVSTAAVINNFAGRQQMVFFISWATDWSPTSNFLQHAYIQWMTRGVYAGYRRVNFNTQIDDMMLYTEIYNSGNPPNSVRLTTSDMNTIKSWVPTIQAKMNPGSWYLPEIGYNGNGNLIYVDPDADLGATCNGGPIYLDYGSTPLEFKKPLGTGTNTWPTTPSSYSYSLTNCLNKDPLSVWFQTAANRASFLHLSHTFTHLAENNATYSDIYKEINWNQQWLAQVKLTTGNFSANALIPPAITGLHNGDALKAWSDNGITNAVGDNSRPPLRNQQNYMWPYTTTVANDGFAGMTVIPRWSNRIYYNCDTPACTLQEWIDTSAGSGDFNNLMAQEKADTMRYLFGLYHDGYMFHQINLRNVGMADISTPYGPVKSLFQAWVNQAVAEFTRLVNWPMQTLKQSDLAISFKNRQARDACVPTMRYTFSAGKITGLVVGANGNSCSAPIPVTVPGPVTVSPSSATSALEKIGNDPLTVWVKLSGSPVTLTLTTPVTM